MSTETIGTQLLSLRSPSEALLRQHSGTVRTITDGPHYIYDLILYLCIMYYTVCCLTGILCAVVRQISMLFIDNKMSVFCILVVSVDINFHTAPEL